jgi:ABC-type polysaccharide/polyol phosphate transport system ATPase subunit
MDDDIALAVKHVSKDFKLPHERKSTLKEWVLHFHKPKFERLHALHDIDFEVKRGEFFGIVGRNGSGKSTMLKIIGGIYQPSKGSVTINGTLTPFIELGIGFNPELTGRENVYLNGAILGLTRREINAKYTEIVEFAELARFMDQKLKNYSSGMQVRLAFSIAIRAHNDILLIDEVLAVGDAAFQAKCLNFFQQLKDDPTKTVIFISHDMEAVRRYCDRALMIEDSKAIIQGNTGKVIDEYLKANTVTFDDENPFGIEGEAQVEKNVATITDVWMEDNDGKKASQYKKDYTIAMRVKYHRACVSPVPGVVVRNIQGLRVTASNTKWAGVEIGTYKANDVATYRFKFMNVLEKGTYQVSANLVSNNFTNFYAWKNDAVHFFVEKNNETGGLADPPYEVTIQ